MSGLTGLLRQLLASPLAVAMGGTGRADGGNLLPAGAVDFFAMNAPPTGYLAANGAAVSRTAYAALYAAIGTTFGAGDGSTTFLLPDLRGYFVRGWAAGGTVDSGRAFGSTQAADIAPHTHPIAGVSVTTGSGGTAGFTYNQGSAAPLGSFPTLSTGGSETRPVNVALLACIKY